MEAGDADLHVPYWRLAGSGGEQQGIWSLVTRLSSAVRPVWNVLSRAGPHAALVVMGAQLFSGLATAGGLLLTTQALEKLLQSGTDGERIRAAVPGLLLLCLVLVAKMVLDAVALSARAYLLPKVRCLAEEDVYHASLAVELASFDDPAFYDQLHRARDRGVLHIEGATTSLVEVMGAGFALAGAGIALCLLHPLLLLMLVVAMLPEGGAALNAARLQYAGMATTIALTRQVQMMGELATGRESAPEIRANQAQEYVLSEYRKCAAVLQKHLMALGLAEARSITLGRFLSTLGMVGTFVGLALMLRAQWLDLAVAGTAVIAIRTASGSLARMMQMLHEVFEKGLYIGDYRAFLEDARRRSRPADGVAAPERPGRIELKAVGFHYPGQKSRAALSNVSLRIDAGQTIALVGENGSGKTTLAKLIAGLYRPTSGQITWDGIDLGDIAPDSLADRVVMVQQEPIRWPRSAEDNIRLGRYARYDPDGKALREAARQSHALEMIERLPEGWQTLLSREFRGGQDLSAGQWQRLAVARGLYRAAPLVIWDEPTAPLDARAEQAVYESLRKLARDRTVILITHRLASVRKADRILFLEGGSLVEQGSHEDLMGLNGRYAELCRLQSQLHGLEEGHA